MPLCISCTLFSAFLQVMLFLWPSSSLSNFSSALWALLDAPCSLSFGFILVLSVHCLLLCPVFHQEFVMLSCRGMKYQEQILSHRVIYNSICSHMVYWKCILNSPYLENVPEPSKLLKILSFNHVNKNVLLDVSSDIYWTFQVLNIFLNNLLLLPATVGKFTQLVIFFFFFNLLTTL